MEVSKKLNELSANVKELEESRGYLTEILKKVYNHVDAKYLVNRLNELDWGRLYSNPRLWQVLKPAIINCIQDELNTLEIDIELYTDHVFLSKQFKEGADNDN